jgi:predicted nucleic acid-binding protein
MASLKVVLDTNALLRSISRRSAFSIILDKLYEGDYELWVSNDILLIDIDKDDNKFSDCAFAGNVHYLVTNDKHFNVLSSVSFPSINVITLEVFKDILSS